MSERRTDEIESGSWPTADTVMRKSRKAMTASTENGRRSGGGNSSPPGLEQAVEIVAGTIPPEMQGIHLPPATERFIGMAKRSWTTPQAQGAKQTGSAASIDRDLLSSEVVRLWATPHANAANGAGRHGDGGPNLQTQVQETLQVQRVAAVQRDWLTPKASDGRPKGVGGADRSKGLTLQVRDCTTPQAHDAQGVPNAARHGRFGTKHGGRNLPDHVAFVQNDWPTATAADAMGSGSAGYGKVSRSTGRRRSEGVTLTDATVGPRGPASRSTSGRPRGYLNPRWVLQLQGFPATYLDGVEVP